MHFPLLLVSFALIVWLAVLLRYGGLFAGCLIVLLSAVCLGYDFWHASVITIDRLLLAGLAAGAVIYWSRTGIRFPAIDRCDVLLTVLLVALFVVTFSRDWRINSAQPASRFLLLYAAPATLYWLVSRCRLSGRASATALATLGALSVYLGVIGSAEVLGANGLVFPRHVLTSANQEFLGRARGPLLNPVANGLVIGVGMTSLLGLWPLVPRALRLFLLPAMLIAGLGLIATLTRSVWLGAALSLLTLHLIRLPRRAQTGYLLIATVLATVVLPAGWEQVAAFKRDKNVSAAEMAQSARLRPMLAVVAWQMFRDHPLGGVGLGQYKEHDNRYIEARQVDLPLEVVRPYHQHNVVLSLLAETGLAATMPFLALLGCWAATAWKLSRSSRCPASARAWGSVLLALLVAYLANGMFHDTALIAGVHLLLFFVAGTAMAHARAAALLPVGRPLSGQPARGGTLRSAWNGLLDGRPQGSGLG